MAKQGPETDPRIADSADIARKKANEIVNGGKEKPMTDEEITEGLKESGAIDQAMEDIENGRGIEVVSAEVEVKTGPVENIDEPRVIEYSGEHSGDHWSPLKRGGSRQDQLDAIAKHFEKEPEKVDGAYVLETADVTYHVFYDSKGLALGLDEDSIEFYAT